MEIYKRLVFGSRLPYPISAHHQVQALAKLYQRAPVVFIKQALAGWNTAPFVGFCSSKIDFKWFLFSYVELNKMLLISIQSYWAWGKGLLVLLACRKGKL